MNKRTAIYISVLSALAYSGVAASQDMLEEVISQLHDFTDDADQFDDITLLGVCNVPQDKT